MAYSTDLRVRVVAAYEEGDGTIDQIAERFSVAPRTVDNWLRLKRRSGSVKREKNPGGRPRLLDEQGEEELRRLVRQWPDATLDEYCEELERRCGICLANPTMSQNLTRMGLSRKKNSRRL